MVIVGPLFFANRLAMRYRERGWTVSVIFHGMLWRASVAQGLSMLEGADVVYFMYASLRNPELAQGLRRRGTPKIIVHFIGSDVLELQSASGECQGEWLAALETADRTLAVSPALAEKLEPHVRADVVPLNFRCMDGEFTPFPDRFTVLAYLPPKGAEFYGLDFVSRLIEDHPDCRFVLLGRGPELSGANVEVHDLDYDRDMSRVYAQTSVLVRLTEHDGLSNMVMEALSNGRQVIWTQRFPFCHEATRDHESVRGAFTKARAAGANRDAIEWVRENLNHERILNELENIFRDPAAPIREYRLDRAW